MIEIISPEKFKQTPWKNGKGFTTELAINDGGDLNSFDWRLSIASVVENGFFSDFSGYKRDLVLIKGNGLLLEHDQTSSDNLDNVLDVATFNGAAKTYGRLFSGPINDFNLMVKIDKFESQLKTYSQLKSYRLEPNYLTFIYSLDHQIEINCAAESLTQTIPAGYLIKINDNKSEIIISGSNLILSTLKPIYL